MTFAGTEINFRIHKQLIKSYKQNFIKFKILEALVFCITDGLVNSWTLIRSWRYQISILNL